VEAADGSGRLKTATLLETMVEDTNKGTQMRIPFPLTLEVFPRLEAVDDMQITVCIQRVSALGCREVGFIGKHGQNPKLV
jgi:hypothetical protein